MTEPRFAYVPAAPGTWLLGIYVDNTPKPTLDDLFTDQILVVAWKIDTKDDGESAIPICAEARSADGHYFLIGPGECLIELDGGTYDNLEAAKKDVLKWRLYELEREAKRAPREVVP